MTQTAPEKCTSILDRVPIDILALIFTDYVHDPSTQDHTSLSHTCRKFRSVALSLPSLWASLNSRMCVEEAKLYLSRCAEMDLKVSIFRPTRSHGRHRDKWWNFVFTVTPLSHRWSEFVFDLGGFNTHRRFYKTMCHVFGRIAFPKLRHVSLRYNDASRWVSIENDHAPENRPPYFHAMWSASSIPIINSLSLTNLFETFDIGRMLSKLELTLRPWESIGIHTCRNIFKLLSETPLIEELRLNNHAVLESQVLPERLELKMIKRLFVQNTYFSGDYPWDTDGSRLPESTHALQELLQSLHMPNLAQFDCKLTVRMEDEHEQLAHLLAFDSAARARDVVVAFDGLSSFNGAFTLETVLASFPNLQRLTIKSAVLPWNLDDVRGNLQDHPIRSIVFMECLFLSHKFLEDIESTAGSRWAHFIGCSMIECTYYEEEQESLAMRFPAW